MNLQESEGVKRNREQFLESRTMITHSTRCSCNVVWRSHPGFFLGEARQSRWGSVPCLQGKGRVVRSLATSAPDDHCEWLLGAGSGQGARSERQEGTFAVLSDGTMTADQLQESALPHEVGNQLSQELRAVDASQVPSETTKRT